MSQKKDFNKIWIPMLAITTALFLIIGSVMILFDNKYLKGIQYLGTSLLFLAAIYLLSKKKVNMDNSNPKSTMFNLGFIFAVIGLTSSLGASMNIGVWGLGIVFFVSGLINNKE